MEVIIVHLENLEAKGQLKPFRFDEARELLAFEKRLGVKCHALPATSNYIFTDDGNLIARTSPAENQGTEEPTGDSKGEAKTDQAQTTHGTGNRGKRMAAK